MRMHHLLWHGHLVRLARFQMLLNWRWNKVCRILRAKKLQYHMPCLSETFNLNLYYISNVKVLAKLPNRVFILNDPTHPNIQRAINSVFSIVLDKCLYDWVYLELFYTLYVSVDKGILRTKRCLPHDFVEDCNFLIVLLSMLVELVQYLEVSVLTLHSLIYLRKV